MKKNILLILLIVSVVFNSCYKEEYPDYDFDTTTTSSANNNMGATVDGSSWKASSLSGSLVTRSGSSKYFLIQGQNSSGQNIALYLNSNPVINTTYDLELEIGKYYNTLVYTDSSDSYSAISGTATIVKYDPVNKTLGGTYKAKVEGLSTDKTIQILNGTFLVQYKEVIIN